MKIPLKGKQVICKFYVVKYSTAIIGIADSEKLDLVRGNFDVIERENSIIHNIESYSFKKQIEADFPDLFHGIGCMEGEISIKLCESAIPHTEPIRHVPHAMQEPLKLELDKPCKEGILHKVDISQLNG